MKKILIIIGFMLVIGLSACVVDTTTEMTTIQSSTVITTTTSNTTTVTTETTTISSDVTTTETTEPVSTTIAEYIVSLSNPYNIGLFVTEDLSTSMGINFEMPTSTAAFVEYSVSGEDNFTRLEATQKLRYFKDKEVYLYEAVMDNLDPGTTYEYRVVNNDGTETSDFHEFTTINNNDESHTIMYLADPQENAEFGYMAYAFGIYYTMEFSQTDFDLVMSPGDLVQDNDVRSEWNWFFQYSSLFTFNKPLAATLGNHEMTVLNHEYVNSLEFDGYLNLPNNGPTYNDFDELFDDQRASNFDDGKTYSFDIGEAHIVVIDTEVYCDGSTTCTLYDHENAEILNQWVRDDLANSTSTWNIVMLHRGPYSLSYNTVSVRDNLVPIFDEYNVDLVLAGHDHQYSRAIYQDNTMITFARSNDYTHGTVTIIPEDPANLDLNNYSSSLGVTYLTPNTTSTKFYGGEKSSGIEVNYAFVDEFPVFPMIKITEKEIHVVS